MKRILLSSLLLSSLVLADKIAIPMPASSLAIENSGQLSAIDAYQDGVGIYTVEQIGSAVIDNSEMNSLVYKYGAEAKATGVNVKEYILSSGSAAEKVLAGGLGKFKPIVPSNGTVCNDNNIQTINDKYVNGICLGTNVEGITCNDNNLNTYNDKYINGICNGTIPTSCNNLKSINSNSPTGYYNIDNDSNKSTAPMSLYCDMTTAGGGWTRLQIVNSSFTTNSSQYNWSMYSPILSDFELTYSKFMLKNNGTFIDWSNVSSSWGSSGIDAQLLDIKYTDNTFSLLSSVRDTILSDAGTIRPCLFGTVTTNTCHSIYIGNIPNGKRIKHFWDDEAKRAVTGEIDYTNVNTDYLKFEVYVR